MCPSLRCPSTRDSLSLRRDLRMQLQLRIPSALRPRLFTGDLRALTDVTVTQAKYYLQPDECSALLYLIIEMFRLVLEGATELPVRRFEFS